VHVPHGAPRSARGRRPGAARMDAAWPRLPESSTLRRDPSALRRAGRRLGMPVPDPRRAQGRRRRWPTAPRTFAVSVADQTGGPPRSAPRAGPGGAAPAVCPRRSTRPAGIVRTGAGSVRHEAHGERGTHGGERPDVGPAAGPSSSGARSRSTFSLAHGAAGGCVCSRLGIGHSSSGSFVHQRLTTHVDEIRVDV
jgi:hypothetical protein